MPPAADPSIASFLHAVSDSARRRILQAMRDHARNATEKSGLCAGDIEERVKLSQPTVSHHMKILEKAGLVEVKKEGTWRRYRRNDKLIAGSISALKKQL